MTINGDIVSISTVGGVRGAAQEKKAEPAKGQAASTAATPDRVELSLGKGEVDRLKQAAAAGSEFQADKVSALKARIAEGTYRVDASAVAAKIVEKFRGAAGGGSNGQ